MKPNASHSPDCSGLDRNINGRGVVFAIRLLVRKTNSEAIRKLHGILKAGSIETQNQAN
jgi:hypothetical protein